MQKPGLSPVHASAVLIGAKAVLIRGVAGSGKTSLALELLNSPMPFEFTRLVADDRVYLAVHDQHVIASAPAPISGLAERRGLGILQLTCEPMAAVGLVVDIADEAPARLPEPKQFATKVMGIRLQRLALQRFDPHAAAKVKLALAIVYRGAELANGSCNEAKPAIA